MMVGSHFYNHYGSVFPFNMNNLYQRGEVLVRKIRK